MPRWQHRVEWIGPPTTDGIVPGSSMHQESRNRTAGRVGSVGIGSLTVRLRRLTIMALAIGSVSCSSNERAGTVEERAPDVTVAPKGTSEVTTTTSEVAAPEVPWTT